MALKKRGGGGGANWMDTYGDMVTLLLCFFVLLYSMSTISQEKWKALVESFNPDALPTQTEIEGGNDGPVSDPDDGGKGLDSGMGSSGEDEMTQEDIDSAIEQLYQALKSYAENSSNAQNVEVTKGDGYVFVSFNDAVFFDGESYALREEGKAVLDVMANAMDVAAPYIDEVRVMGHTAQADPNRANRTEWDRILSSSRAAEATAYIQEHCSLEPGRLVSVGYGQHRPVDTNLTTDGRAHNRRVEMLITGLNLLDEMGDSIQHYESMREGQAGAADTQADGVI